MRFMDKINTVMRYSSQDRIFYELRWYHELVRPYRVLSFFNYKEGNYEI